MRLLAVAVLVILCFSAAAAQNLRGARRELKPLRRNGRKARRNRQNRPSRAPQDEPNHELTPNNIDSTTAPGAWLENVGVAKDDDPWEGDNDGNHDGNNNNDIDDGGDNGNNNDNNVQDTDLTRAEAYLSKVGYRALRSMPEVLDLQQVSQDDIDALGDLRNVPRVVDSMITVLDPRRRMGGLLRYENLGRDSPLEHFQFMADGTGSGNDGIQAVNAIDGHTIARHVLLDPRTRLGSNLRTAASFTNLATAQQAVYEAVQASRISIETHIGLFKEKYNNRRPVNYGEHYKNPPRNSPDPDFSRGAMWVQHDFQDPIGTVWTWQEGGGISSTPSRRLEMVIDILDTWGKDTQGNSPTRFIPRIITAYPIP